MKSALKPMSLLILLGFVWGSGYSIARFAMTHGVPPLGYAFWQSWGPAFFLILIYTCRRRFTRQHASKAASKKQPTFFQLMTSRTYLPYFLFTALLGIVIPNTNMYLVAAHLPAGVLAVIVNIVPLLVYPIALFMKQESFSKRRLFGVALGFLGIVFILAPHTTLSHTHWASWALLALLSPLCFALCAVLCSKYQPEKADAIALSAGMLLFSALILTPIVFKTHQFFFFNAHTMMANAAVGLEIFLSSLGYVLFFALISTAGPVYYSLVGGLVTLTGLFWGKLLFDEKITAPIMLATLLILTAIALVNFKWRTQIDDKTNNLKTHEE
jgi:drug/metabolite transporter (DMT)-like permease